MSWASPDDTQGASSCPTCGSRMPTFAPWQPPEKCTATLDPRSTVTTSTAEERLNPFLAHYCIGHVGQEVEHRCACGFTWPLDP